VALFRFSPFQGMPRVSRVERDFTPMSRFGTYPYRTFRSVGLVAGCTPPRVLIGRGPRFRVPFVERTPCFTEWSDGFVKRDGVCFSDHSLFREGVTVSVTPCHETGCRDG